uniref:Uncharacterized protein n=1 Tax=Haemonchus contortus TaxID=6289 RepID=A0A7I4Y2D6_HAECO
MDRYLDGRQGRTARTGGHAQTDTDRQRDMDGQTRRWTGTYRGDRRGQTRTHTHKDVACTNKDNTHTDRQDKKEKTVDRSFRPSALQLTRSWATIAHTDLKWTELM